MFCTLSGPRVTAGRGAKASVDAGAPRDRRLPAGRYRSLSDIEKPFRIAQLVV